jgi:hypothetical protein
MSRRLPKRKWRGRRPRANRWRRAIGCWASSRSSSSVVMVFVLRSLTKGNRFGLGHSPPQSGQFLEHTTPKTLNRFGGRLRQSWMRRFERDKLREVF